MTDRQKDLLQEMTNQLTDNEKKVYLPIINYLIALGYLPERRKASDFSLAFKHKASKKIMARFDMRQVKKHPPFPIVSIKFFDVEDVPARYTEALVKALEGGMHWSAPVLETDRKRCPRCGYKCTGGNLGYYHQFSDGTEVLRCGAYPIPIPDLDRRDVEEMKRVILRQHEYFCSLT